MVKPLKMIEAGILLPRTTTNAMQKSTAGHTYRKDFAYPQDHDESEYR